MVRSALVIALVSCGPLLVSCVPPAPTPPPWLSWLKHEGISCASRGQDYHQQGVPKLEDCQELCMKEDKCQGVTAIANAEGLSCWLLSGVGASQAPLDVTRCETKQSGADTYAYFRWKSLASASDAIDGVAAVSADSRQLFGLDEIGAGINFAAGIIGDIAGAIGSAIVEAFRLAMRLLRALIIMVKTIVQLICNVVGDLMDTAGDVISSLMGGASSFFDGSLTFITKVVQIGFTTSALVHDHIVEMFSRLPSMITGALQMDELLEAAKAVLAVNPFGRPPYEADAAGLQQAATDLQNAVFEDGARRLSSRRRMSSPRRRAPTPRDTRRRAPDVRRRAPPPPPPASLRRRAPPVSTKTPKKPPKSSYGAMAAPAMASSAYRRSSKGKKDGGIMRKIMKIVSAYYMYSQACEFYQLSIQGVVAIASIFPGGFEEGMEKLQVTVGQEAKFEDFVLSKLLADEVLACPYTTCTSSLFSTGYDNLKKVGKAVTGDDDTSQLPTLAAPKEVTSVDAMKAQRKCRGSGYQCVPEASKCVHPRAVGNPCVQDVLPKHECADSAGLCFELAVNDETQWYVAEVNDTYFSACPVKGERGVQCQDIGGVEKCYWMDPSPACGEDAEPWCFEPAKYVPAPGCPGAPAVSKKSAYFPDSNLYYSYTACNGQDLFPNQVNDTCAGSSYLTCKAPCVWYGEGMPATTLCKNKRPTQTSSKPFEAEPGMECGEYVEECLGMYSVMEIVLASSQPSKFLENYAGCKAAMESPNVANERAQVENACKLKLTAEALEKSGYVAPTKVYPATYLSNCTECGQPWAEPAIHECRRDAIDSGDAPLWCSQAVCFVSAQHPDSAPSQWFPGSGLFFSYRQCGSFDVFSLGKSSCDTIEHCTDALGCEVNTDKDDPFCCVEIKVNDSDTPDTNMAAGAANRWAMLWPLLGAIVGLTILRIPE